MSLTKFHITEKAAIKEYYDSHGYVVIEGLLNSSKILNFLNSYEKIKHSKFFVFSAKTLTCLRSQS